MDLNSENTWTTSLDSDWFHDTLNLDLKIAHITSLDSDWFYDILDFHLKNAWTTLLDSDWFCNNQARMPLEKYENLLELSVK